MTVVKKIKWWILSPPTTHPASEAHPSAGDHPDTRDQLFYVLHNTL